ncbi:MAG: hypothetical protein GY740_04710, partial [Gammaproteobacteria bacterium]|nr:hypothetical protein [Gammaproteobacteria bacterium]
MSQRLNEIYTSDTSPGHWGDLNVVFFGDFLQLKPVEEPFIFEPMSANAGAARTAFYRPMRALVKLWSEFDFVELTTNV